MIASCVAPGVVPGGEHHRGRRIVSGLLGYQRVVVDHCAGGDRLAGAPHPEHTIGADKPEHAVFAQHRCLIGADEIACVHRNRHHSIEALLSIHDAPAEGESPLVRVLFAPGRADHHAVLLARALKEVQRRDVLPAGGVGAGDNVAVDIGDVDREEELGG
jgi:hypothetical protein